MEQDLLEKTNRINKLFDFYEQLLTEKQQTFLKYYFHDDYSLGEIAAESNISRQAVFEHIKRAESSLEEYEAKLQLLKKHEAREDVVEQLSQLAEKMFSGTSAASDRETWKRLLERLKTLDLDKLE